MAKKSSKKQSKQPNTDNSATEPAVNIPLTEEPTTTATNKNTVPPAASPPVSVSSPSPMLPITDAVSIERLVGLAKNSAPDSALGIVWKHAYEEGYQNGRLALLQNLEKKLDEKYKEGEKEGINKGKEKYYGKGIVKGESEEYKRWTTAGHSGRCFKLTAILGDASIQTDPLSITTTSISTQTDSESNITVTEQTNPISTLPTSYLTSGTQTNTLYTSWHPKMEVSVQTNPISTQLNCHATKFPSASPALLTATPSVSTTTIGTQMNTTTSQPLEIGLCTCVATLQTTESSENGKFHKNPPYSEFSTVFGGFSSPTPSLTVYNSQTSSTTTPAHETRQKTAEFTTKVEKVEFSPNSTKTTPQTPSLSILEHTDNVTRLHTTPPTHNNLILQPPTTSTVASSSQHPAVTKHQRSEILGADFESQRLTESPVPTTTATALKTRPETPSFVENCPKVEKSPYFNQNHPELPKSPVSEHFNWANNAGTLPNSPCASMKQPRDMSHLRSSMLNPFSSLQRRRRQSRNSRRFSSPHCQYHCPHQFSKFHHYSPTPRLPHHLSQPPFTALLNWDQDPRLADLSSALRALGWVRR